ncbi:hypothetical protein LCM20_17635 [Halobacillus litoralis]|uniref:hypothetical protein n=1 Tax=Halobacillus litoralis TaxID=45668 RepID=UPI001CD2ED2B|nr:hypothetical protein [Halobacillus litoralis]MCA0972420.1 hypothetical protein [Halobacillus litoralis]
MTNERNTSHSVQNPTHSQCVNYKNYYVVIQLNDGRQVDGIITDVTKDKIEMMVSETVEGQEGQSEDRQFGRWGYRRFRPGFFPVAALTSLALLPFVRPYPYYAPYPYYGPYPYYY